jgi:transcriptional regulator with XRE-family HTH domain
VTQTTGPVAAPRDDDEPSATQRAGRRSTSGRAGEPVSGRTGQGILPSGKMLAPWDDDAMSAARSATKKKPRSGPKTVSDPAPAGEAVEPSPQVVEATEAEQPVPGGVAPDEDAEPAAPGVGPRPNAWAAPMNALGGFIRAQRQLAKLSLRDMATMTSVSNAYLSQVERGLHQPSLKVLHSIADALQLSTEQLLSQAGWATQPADHTRSRNGGTEEAIRTDPRLTPEQRTALLGVYRSFVDGTA